MKSANSSRENNANPFRHRIHEIIFEADTKMGLLFDALLLVAILLSVIVVCLETVESINDRMGTLFLRLEWLFTILFTIEYILRLYCVKRPLRYATSFFGIVDLLAILPTYLTLLFAAAPSLAVVRAFRLLRVFRIFKLIGFLREADELGRAIMRARAKIIVFLGVVVVSITVAGTLMYEIENWGDGVRASEFKAQQRALAAAMAEGDFETADEVVEKMKALSASDVVASKFSNIPQSMYWATVTMTTVGYGDIVPQTVAGKIVAAILILLGYSLIIVPTGFVSAEFMELKRGMPSTQSCPYCMLEGHDADAIYCKQCGEAINEDSDVAVSDSATS